MSKPRKFKRVLSYADEAWAWTDLVGLLIDVIATVPHEYCDSIRVELVLNDWGDDGSAAYLAVTAEMTDSFDYTDSGWEPD